MNPFEQYVKWLDDNTLGGNLLQIAYRVHTRHRKELPDGIKGILAGTDEADSGVLFLAFKLISRIEGSVELAYRRGHHAGTHDAYLTIKKKYPKAGQFLLNKNSMDKDGVITLTQKGINNGKVKGTKRS